ncbi:MAG: nucleotidyltransferase family protein [Pseudomonadota bacterium]
MTHPSALIPALVLAGERPAGTDPMATSGALNGAAHKAFLPLNGRPMLDYVFSALNDADDVGTLTMSAPAHLHAAFGEADPEMALLASANSPAQSIAAALAHFQDAPEVLVTTCDHPLLTPQIVTQFIERARAQDVDVSVGCVTRSVFKSSFPSAKRTFVALRDIQFSGANLFYIRPANAGGLFSYWVHLEQHRKNPLALARAIGLGLAIRYAFGRLTLHKLLETVEARCSTRCTLVPLDDPVAAIDVDKPADIALATRLLQA